MSNTIKFNAGKVQYDEETHRCNPLPHKGIVTIKPSLEDEEFYDFIWTPKGNGSGNVEKDELLIIPGDVSFKQVKSCDTGRVLALKFLSSGARHLYWLQDVGDDEILNKLTPKDEELIKDVNSIISVPEDKEDGEEEELEGKKVKLSGGETQE